jgi:SAM-dependent methyltransferase
MRSLIGAIAMNLEYSPQYYRGLNEGSRRSAQTVVPIIVELLHPKSVVDVGCGTGAWLAEFTRRGVGDILGIDGHHVPVDQLQIDQHDFVAADLTQPLRLRRYFDLAMSLEVAEHLSPEKADQFVDSLTRLAPTVLFSAAIPFQGGEHHLNEQWPTYWVERFDKRDYAALDPFRRLLWEQSEVEWWYCQNLVLFVRRDFTLRIPVIAEIVERGVPTFVHPNNYLKQVWQNKVLRVSVDLATQTRPGDVIVLADEDRFGSLYLPDRTVRPIVEREGAYHGPPADGAEAVIELNRMKAEGANYFAVGWPAFWWLTHYEELATWLKRQHALVLQNENLVLYRLSR